MLAARKAALMTTPDLCSDLPACKSRLYLALLQEFGWIGTDAVVIQWAIVEFSLCSVGGGWPFCLMLIC